MTSLLPWGASTLAASAVLLVVVLLIRTPVRRLVGPRLGYALWALPVIRLLLPSLPADWLAGPAAGGAAAPMSMLVIGPANALVARDALASSSIGELVSILWLVGAAGIFAFYAVRHVRFCRRLWAQGVVLGSSGSIPVIATKVEGPLAFGVRRRCIAVPRAFERDYDAGERDLALAHESAHHARGDLVANWVSLIVLAVHWWNPVAWIAVRAFRMDQELAVDAHVLGQRGPGALAPYAHVIAKAAGLGALPACNLNTRSNLKGRLMSLRQNPRSDRRQALGRAALILIGTTALAATAATRAAAPAPGRQVVTVGVKPDGSGGYALVVGGKAVAPGTALPGGLMLPADFSEAGGCQLQSSAKPVAMVIKGSGTTQTYTVMCASAAPVPIRRTLAEGLDSLNTMRASVASQPASKLFPEAERKHALGAIDRSIREVKGTLAAGA